jgi:predicted deacetylase
MAEFILRFDDYCAVSNTVLERRLLEIVAGCGGKVVMSVVPFVADTEWELRGPIPLRPLSPEKAAMLKEFVPRHAEVTLHGYSHQTITRWSHLYEFGDRVAQQRQVSRLRDGRGYLEDLFGVAVETFVPPWNEYGRTTLAALAEAGFKLLSGDLGLGAAEGELAFVPACCPLGRLGEALAASTGDAAAAVCVLIHEYDFKESGWPQASTDLAALPSQLAAVTKAGARWTDFNECRRSGEWDANRLKANRELRQALASPGRRLLHEGTAGVYWSEDQVTAKVKRLNFTNPRRLLRWVN